MKRTFRRLRIAGPAAIAIAACAAVTGARADLYVLESTVTSIQAGARLADTDQLTIPSGGHIRAVLPSGKTQTIRGPYSGAVSDLSKGQTANEGVMTWLRTMLQTGGASEATPGATRSIAIPVAKPSFSWTALPTTVDGTFCIEKGSKLQLVRPSTAGADRVTILDATNSQRGEVQWPSGGTSVAWPAGISVRPDGAYYILVPDRPRREVTLKVMDRLPADDEVLAELQKRGCKVQFEAWVRATMKRS